MFKKIVSIVVVLLLSIMVASTFASSKMRVAIVDFRNNASGPTPVTDAVRRAITDMFTTELYKTHMYSIVERSRIQAIAREHRLAASGLVDSATAIRLGKLLGVQAIITGSITQFTFKQSGGVLPIPGIGGIAVGEKKAYVTLDVRMINVETGEIMLVARATGEATHTIGGIGFKGAIYAEGQVQGILAAATYKCVKKIVRKFYMENAEATGGIHVVRGGMKVVYIDVGSATGDVRNGDYFAAYVEGAPIKGVSGEILGVEKLYLGVIKITETHPRYSIGKVIKGGPLKRGDKVIPISAKDVKKIVISQRSARDISKLFNKGKKTESTKTVPSTSRRQDGNTSSSSTPKISPKNGIANTSDSIKVIDYFPILFELKENLKRIHKQWWWNYSRKRYKRSIKILKEAIKLYKGDYLAYYWIGEVYYEIGNKKSAIKYWKIGHEINPNYVPINRKLKKVGAL